MWTLFGSWIVVTLWKRAQLKNDLRRIPLRICVSFFLNGFAFLLFDFFHQNLDFCIRHFVQSFLHHRFFILLQLCDISRRLRSIPIEKKNGKSSYFVTDAKKVCTDPRHQNSDEDDQLSVRSCLQFIDSQKL